MNIRKVGIVGAGTMGNGIAQVFAQSGFEVTIRDVGQPQIERGMSSIKKSLGKVRGERKDYRRRKRSCPGAHRDHHRPVVNLAGLRPGCGGHFRELRRKGGSFSRA